MAESGTQECVACGGDVTPLGQLGRMEWGRCRNCGLDQHKPMIPLNNRQKRKAKSG